MRSSGDCENHVCGWTPHEVRNSIWRLTCFRSLYISSVSIGLKGHWWRLTYFQFPSWPLLTGYTRRLGQRWENKRIEQPMPWDIKMCWASSRFIFHIQILHRHIQVSSTMKSNSTLLLLAGAWRVRDLSLLWYDTNYTNRSWTVQSRKFTLMSRLWQAVHS